MRCGLDSGFVNGFQRRFIEVAAFVGVRIEEEALRAALHGTGGLHNQRIQNLKGFLRIRPVFFRMELTLLSSFFFVSGVCLG